MARSVVASNAPRARSEPQSCTPDWNITEAAITVSTIGMLAIRVNTATSRTCSRPPPASADLVARWMAIRRPISTISAT